MKKEDFVKYVGKTNKKTEIEIKVSMKGDKNDFVLNKNTETCVVIWDEGDRTGVNCSGAFTPKTIMGFVEALDSIKKELLMTGIEGILGELPKSLKDILGEE